MRVAVFLAMMVWLGAGHANAQDAASQLCGSNPAYSESVMRSVLEAQLEKDHDPALDAESPEKMAAEASAQGIKDCATELQRDAPLYKALASYSGTDLQVGWDAYNTACADHTASKAECVKAEVGSVRALKRMMATNEPPGSKALVETCELVLKTDPAMADWRECVDTALSIHAPAAAATKCKTAVPWHTAKTGTDAGKLIATCLQAQ